MKHSMLFEDMLDLRDRAYLIIYSENKSLGQAMKVKQEEIKILIDKFIKQTDSIESTRKHLQKLYNFGYPVHFDIIIPIENGHLEGLTTYQR